MTKLFSPLAVVSSAVLLAVTPAMAQQPPPDPAAAPASAAGAESTPAQEEARQRFERGMQLYSDGAYDLALIELQRAYDLAPSYKLLYNIAQVNAQLSNYAGALRAFEKYLADGGSDVAPERRTAVEKEIQTLRARTANITVRVNVPNAEIVVDGLPQAGQAQDAAFLVNAGVRRIGVRKPGYQPAEKVLTLAGGDSAEVQLELVEIAPSGPVGPVGPVLPPPPPPKEEPSYLWIGWLSTGVLAAGAVVTGIGALGAQGDLEDELATPVGDGQTPAEKAEAIDDAESQRMTLAVATDILAGAAIIAGGVTLAFTIAEATDDGTTASAASPATSVQLGVRPTGLDLRGTF